MNLDQKLVFSDTIFAREIDDEMVLLDMGSENYFGLDVVATDIWKLLKEGKTLRETYETLLEIYEVEPARLEDDLRAFVNSLLEHNLAKIVEAS